MTTVDTIFGTFPVFEWKHWDLTLKTTTYSALFWFGLYFICSIAFENFAIIKSYAGFTNEKKREWNERIGSSIHAIVSCLLVIYCYYHTYPTPFQHFFTHDEELYVITLAFSTGYMFADFFLTIWIGPHQSGFYLALLHHVIGFIAFGESAVSGGSQGLVLLMVATEASTPFVNMRWFLDVCGMKEGTLYLINGLSMILVFFLCRILPSPFVVFKMITQWTEMTSQNLPVVLSTIILTILINMLNYFWFYKMMVGLVSVLSKKPKDESKKK